MGTARLHATTGDSHLSSARRFYTLVLIVELLPKHSEVPSAAIEKSHAHMERFYQAQGESLAWVCAVRCETAIEMGRYVDYTGECRPTASPANATGTVPLPEVPAICLNEARAIGARFDARNRTDRYERISTEMDAITKDLIAHANKGLPADGLRRR